MLAGAGDELQGIKRGIMEMADLIAITKADGANKLLAENARSLISECTSALSKKIIRVDSSGPYLFCVNQYRI